MNSVLDEIASFVLVLLLSLILIGSIKLNEVLNSYHEEEEDNQNGFRNKKSLSKQTKQKKDDDAGKTRHHR